MNLVTIEKLEEQFGKTVVFPAFDLVLKSSGIAAILCNLNIRESLIQIFEGSFMGSRGNLRVNAVEVGERGLEAGICLLEEGYYMTFS